MTVASRPLLRFENSFAEQLDGLSVPWQAAEPPAPRLLALNRELAAELEADPAALEGPAGLPVLTGNPAPEGSVPVAMAYAGHQFGGFSPILGDGRALLLGEITDVDGRRRDLHLKGSGRTPFARGGDGKAAIGPMLREYVIGEAMHALGIPTSRALAVTATGEEVLREGGPLPGAILARVAASHIRVGTFQYAVGRGGSELVRRLADYSIARHYPAVADAENPYLAFLGAVAEAQASLVSQWMLVGFIHGVMNTDNMAISGESIDYGPCAFMESYDPETVFSSIDHGGRYAYANQPQIAQWNLVRLAEALLEIIDEDADAAKAAAGEVLTGFGESVNSHWIAGLRAKLGLADERPEDVELIGDLLALLAAQAVDFTAFFRALSSARRGDDTAVRAQFADPGGWEAWSSRWIARCADESTDGATAAERMNEVNPVYVPRNLHVEEALDAATAGDLAPFERLVEVVTRPFEERPGLESYAAPAPSGAGYRTFCGT